MAGVDIFFPSGILARDGVELMGSDPELSLTCFWFQQVRHRGPGSVGSSGLHPLAALHVADG